MGLYNHLQEAIEDSEEDDDQFFFIDKPNQDGRKQFGAAYLNCEDPTVDISLSTSNYFDAQ